MWKHDFLVKSSEAVLRVSTVVAIAALLFVMSCKSETAVDPPGQGPGIAQEIPLSPGAVSVPASNPMNAAKIELGRRLFYDTRLSIGGVSCGSCHDQKTGFSDPNQAAFSPGVFKKLTTRNAPGLTNIAYNSFFTWDGKFSTLEKHVPGPMFSQIEMGNNFSREEKRDTTINEGDGEGDGYDHTPGGNDTLLLFKRLQGEPKYAQLFPSAFGDPSISLNRIVNAIAAFERTIISTNSKFDEYNKYLHNGSGSEAAINESAKRGYKVFMDPAKGNCVSCHNGYNFTNGGFHTNGLAMSSSDTGRFRVSKLLPDLHSFKVPTLRNVALSAPYMHDGSIGSLSKVVSGYRTAGMNSHNDESVDTRISAIKLSEEDVDDIVEFLKTLTDESFASNSSLSNPWK